MANLKIHPSSPWRSLAHRFLTDSVLLLGAALMLLAALAPGLAHAQDDPPGRVGRLINLEGQVLWFDDEEAVWTAAQRNRPLTTGDSLATGPDGRVELRVGSSVLRLAPNTQLDVLQLDDERMVWQLHRGSVALRVRTPEAAQETELVTNEVRLRPETAGHYRWDRDGDTTWGGSWLGSLRAQAAAGWLVDSGERLSFWSEGGGSEGGVLRRSFSRLPLDAFAQAVLAEDRADDQRQAQRWVSPEMTGAEDLDRYGQWEQHPEYGALWFPTQVAADWAPYQRGHWTWVRPWGWTWVDDARWGFAPFHYGRWVSWRGRWAWSPGAYVERPVYAPALVAWVGGLGAGIQVSVGRPTVGWLPLAPWDLFVPHYRHTPRYSERINEQRWPDRRDRRPQRPDRDRPGVYGNHAVPGAVTVVPRDVVLRREPVAPALMRDRWPDGTGRNRNGDRPGTGPSAPRFDGLPPAYERGSRTPTVRIESPAELAGPPAPNHRPVPGVTEAATPAGPAVFLPGPPAGRVRAPDRMDVPAAPAATPPQRRFPPAAQVEERGGNGRVGSKPDGNVGNNRGGNSGNSGNSRGNSIGNNNSSRNNDMPAWSQGGRFGPPAPAASPAASPAPAARAAPAPPPAARPAPAATPSRTPPAARMQGPPPPAVVPDAPQRPAPDRASRAPREERNSAPPAQKRVPEQRGRDRRVDREREAER